MPMCRWIFTVIQGRVTIFARGPYYAFLCVWWARFQSKWLKYGKRIAIRGPDLAQRAVFCPLLLWTPKLSNLQIPRPLPIAPPAPLKNIPCKKPNFPLNGSPVVRSHNLSFFCQNNYSRVEL